MEQKVRPWLVQKSIDLLQEEEQAFITLVLALLEQQTSAETCLKRLERFLDVATKDFVKGLWRFMIFEQLKIRNKIIK